MNFPEAGRLAEPEMDPAEADGTLPTGWVARQRARLRDWLAVTAPSDLMFHRGSIATNLARYAVVLVKNVMANNVTRRASSLTYTSILSLFPMFVLVLAMASFFFTPERQDQFIEYLQSKVYPSERGVDLTSGGQVSPEAAENIRNLRTFITERANNFRKSAAGIGFAGFAAMLLAAGIMFAAVEDALDATWSKGHRKSFKRTIMTFMTALVVTPILIVASITVSTVAISARESEQLAQQTLQATSDPGAPAAMRAVKTPGFLEKFQNSAVGTVATAYESVLPVIPILINVLFIAGAYVFIPQASVRFKFALLGGLVAAILWEASKLGFASYVFASSLRREIFFSLGAVPIFLIWIYITWVVFLLGSEIAFTAQNYRRLAYDAFHVRQHTILDGKLFVAAALIVAQRFASGEGPLREGILAHRLGLAAAESDELIRRMLDAGILIHTDKPAGVALARPADALRVSDLLALGCDARSLAAGHADLDAASARCLVDLQSSVAKSLDGMTIAGMLSPPVKEATP